VCIAHFFTPSYCSSVTVTGRRRPYKWYPRQKIKGQNHEFKWHVFDVLLDRICVFVITFDGLEKQKNSHLLWALVLDGQLCIFVSTALSQQLSPVWRRHVRYTRLRNSFIFWRESLLVLDEIPPIKFFQWSTWLRSRRSGDNHQKGWALGGVPAGPRRPRLRRRNLG
jgi:hypothetical protein